MMNRIKRLAWLVALVVLMPLAHAPVHAESGWVTVAVPTQMSGFLFSNMWGSNSVDLDLRAMLHGYDTVYSRSQDDFALDSTVVKTLEVTRERDGDTYTFTLAPGLTYNEGTPITAADYVFSLLLHSSPAVAELGGVKLDLFARGGLGGLRCGNVRHAFRGAAAGCAPIFHHRHGGRSAPLLWIGRSAGQTMSHPGDRSGIRRGGWRGRMLSLRRRRSHPNAASASDRTAAGNADFRERLSHQPKVTCGPYQLVAYDATSSLVELKANPAYLGNAEEQKPSIQRVRVIQLLGAEAVAAFERGEVQIVNRLTDGAAIHQARALDGKQASLSSYFRSGYAFLAFACEQAPTSDVHVRRARGHVRGPQYAVRYYPGRICQNRCMDTMATAQWMTQAGARATGRL